MADTAVHPDADGLVGSVTIWPSDILPGAKYRFCEGEAISRTEFSLCFARLGTKHGTGDGSATFNLPNYKKKFLVGADDGDAAYDVVGDSGGAVSASVSGNTGAGTAHSHGAGSLSVTTSNAAVTTGGAFNVAVHGVYGVAGSTASESAHTHAQSGTVATVPPYTVVRYIIKIA